MKTNKNIISICILSSILFSSCGSNDVVQESETKLEEASDIAELTEAQYKNAGIELGNVEMRTISGTIQANGLLDVPPQSKVSVSAPMGGFVKETELLQGTRVEKGQVLATMQHADYIQLQQDYIDNLSQLEYLKAEYERQEELSNENVSSKKTLQLSKANYFSTKAKTDGLRAKLQLLNINLISLEKGNFQSTVNLYSPISGYVTKVKTNIGMYVNPSDVLFEIVNTEHLHAELTIFEKDVPLLKIGQKVLFTLANEITTRQATVHLIGREINTDRTVNVHCHIDKQDRELIPGMYLKAIVETDSAHVTALPNEAIVTWQGKRFVFIEENNINHKNKNDKAFHFKMVEVSIGENEMGFSHINLPAEIKLNTKIVVKGAFNILAKMFNAEEEE